MSFSGDGRTVTYAAGTPDAPVVYSIPADGSGVPIRLADGRSPMWSPDGTRIAFSNSADPADPTAAWAIYVMDPSAADVEQLTSGPNQDKNPSWSPGGTRIAFLSNREPSTDDYLRAWLIDADGGQPRPLLQGDQVRVDSQPAWASR